VHKAGTVVEYGGNPGSQMEPVDDEAWARFHARQKERKNAGMAPMFRFPFRVIEAKATGGRIRPPLDMSIPEDWRDYKGLNLTNLAKRLGAPLGVNLHHARAFIEDLERKQGKAMIPPQPAGDNPNQASAGIADPVNHALAAEPGPAPANRPGAETDP
jgi:hypothetical protein